MRKLVYCIAAIILIASSVSASAGCLELFQKNNGWWVENSCGQTMTLRVYDNGRDTGLINAPAGRPSILVVSATHEVSFTSCRGFGCNPPEE